MNALPALVVSLAAQSAAGGWYVEHGYPGFGTCVCAAGDVDRDGCEDAWIGDHGSAHDAVEPSMWLVSSLTGRSLRRVRLPGRESLPNVRRGLEYRLAGACDVDADGIPDVLVGVARYDGDPSLVRLFSGADGSRLRDFVVEPPTLGEGTWTRFVADADGDGIRDVAVLNVSTEPRGSTLVVHSSTTGAMLLHHDLPLSGALGLVDAGDVDADGRSDLAVVSQRREDLFVELALLSHRERRPIWTHDSKNVHALHGCVEHLASRPGPDLLAVAFGDRVDVLSARTGELVRRFDGDGRASGASCTEFGWCLAVLDDLDGDGGPELAIAETETNLYEGLIHAKSPTTGRTFWTSRDDGPNAIETYRLGYSLASIGDVDGDGVHDLVAGTCESRAGRPGLAMIVSGRTGAILREHRRRGDDVVALPRAFGPKKR